MLAADGSILAGWGVIISAALTFVLGIITLFARANGKKALGKCEELEQAVSTLADHLARAERNAERARRAAERCADERDDLRRRLARYEAVEGG